METLHKSSPTLARLYYSPRIAQKYHVEHVKAPKVVHNLPLTDIDFHPDLDKFAARAAVSLSRGDLQSEVPGGWPAKLEGTMAWKGSDFQDESRYVYHLTAEDVMEIEDALRHFQALELDIKKVTRHTFPLPKFGKFLAKACDEVYYGIGFIVLRGLDVENYSNRDIILIYLGVSSYFGERRGVQDTTGDVIKHILDFSKVDSSADLPFHTDVTADIVATVTRECSLEGGMATLASAWTVYNQLAATRPDLIHILASPEWVFDTYGRIPAYHKRALMYHTDGKVIANFSRRVLVGHPRAPRSKDIPCITEAQAEALDAVHYLAKANQALVTMEKGDMRFINNMGILHGREAYSDGKELKSKRHLIRLWLHNDEKMWKLHPQLELTWARVFDDDERLSVWQEEPRWDENGTYRHDSPSPSPSPEPAPHPRPDPSPCD